MYKKNPKHPTAILPRNARNSQNVNNDRENKMG